jgi:glycosyltransferase involved in cell wall biosynthesis
LDARVTRVYSTAGPLVDRSDRRQDTLRVLTVGSVTPYKNPIGWIELAHRVQARLGERRVTFTWVGDGPLIDRCRSLVSDDEALVSFVGHREATSSFYADADVYVQSSRVESLGLAALDAARHGVPSLVTKAGGLPETVDAGVSGSVVSSIDSTEAVDALIQLLTDDTRRRAMGSAQQSLYSRRFLPETWASQVLALHARTG